MSVIPYGYKKLDYQHWAKMQSWHLAEAVFLIVGVEPPANERDWEKRLLSDYYHDETTAKIKKIYQAAKRVSWSDPSEEAPLIFDKGLYTELPPSLFLTWARRNGFSIPKELKSPTGNSHEPDISTTELDKLYTKQRFSFNELQNEAIRSYDVYKQLLDDGTLSRDNWGDEIENLKLIIIVPADIRPLHLHYSKKNLNRDIINNVIQSVLKRIDPPTKYTIKDIDRLRKG